tara:strand:+ start:252 stop:584 length:333 start_codon:yes stop_codon:yes gene_type:complete
MNTDLTDCLTIVASYFGRVVSTGIPSGDNKKYCFSFVDSKFHTYDSNFHNYICSVEYLDDEINVLLFLDVVVMFGIDGSKKDAKKSIMMQKKLYRLGGELMAAGHSVKYV